MQTEYTIRMYEGAGVEIILTGGIFNATTPRKKVIYNTGDVVYFVADKVVGIIDWRGVCHLGGVDIELDAAQVPKMTREAKTFLTKKKILDDLEKDPHCYDEYVKKHIGGWNEEKDKMSLNIVKKFFDIDTSKEKK